MLVTTNYVIAEAYALFLARASRDTGIRFLRSIERGAFKIERATLDDELAARSILYRYADKTFSMVDAISFVVMERLGVSVALSFDRDFTQYGFVLAND